MIPFLQARNFTPGPRTRGPILWLVVHDMEALEGPSTAEACANYFHNQAPGPGGSSAHYCLDDNSIVQSVKDSDIAWAAPGANAQGLHFELAGFASQSRDEWLDDYGVRMLDLFAELLVAKAAEHGVPLVWQDAAGVAAGLPGVTSHREVTAAFGTVGGHTDPGPGFPVDYLMGLLVRKSRPLPEVEDEMASRVFEVGPILTGPLTGRWCKVVPELDQRQLRCEVGAWDDGPGVEQIPTYVTSILHLDHPDLERAIGHPLDWPNVSVGQSTADPHVIVVHDKHGDYAFRVA